MPRIIRCNSSSEVGVEAARALSAFVQAEPQSVVALPTGRTVESMYDALAELRRTSRFDLSCGRFFALDEVLCRSGRRPFFDFLTESFVRPCGVDSGRFSVLDPTSGDTELECRRYDKEIERCGGFDVVVLGIGRNGHIAFNEPGSSFDSKTRRVELADDTKRAVAEGFGIEAGDIAGALTVGIATILRSERVLLLATGGEKAPALADSLNGPPDPACPASALGVHGEVTVIADTEALSLAEHTPG